MSSKDGVKEICVLCCREMQIYATGICDHPVCYECSTRMRVLCKQNECPICRRNMPKVIFTHTEQLFTTLSQNLSFVDRKYKIWFEDENIFHDYEFLLEHRCKECNALFNKFAQLKYHVRRQHELFYCELCIENIKIFTFERKCYSRKDLARHRRIGDPDETSHRGHPLCEFCEERYVDNDELFRHLRREHFFCHFCDADGKHQFYRNYDYLRTHFRKEHFLCEEGECENEKFIGAFRTAIDLKAHKALHHLKNTKNMSKAEVKQARTLELEFTITPRSYQNDTSSTFQDESRYYRQGRHNNHQRKRNTEEHVNRETNNSSGYDTMDSGQSQNSGNPTFNTQSVQEFPHLSGGIQNDCSLPENGSVAENHSNSFIIQSFGRHTGQSKGQNAIKEEEFPTLRSTVFKIPSQNNSSSYVTVTSQEPVNPTRKTLHVTFNRQEEKQPTRTSNVSIQLSRTHNVPVAQISNASRQNTVQKGFDFQSRKPSRISDFQFSNSDEQDSKVEINKTNWVQKKKIPSFEEEFPKLADKGKMKEFSSNTCTESSVIIPVSTTTISGQNSMLFGQHISVKCKSKKKKQKPVVVDQENKPLNQEPDKKKKKEPSILTNGETERVSIENQENEDPLKESSVSADNSLCITPAEKSDVTETLSKQTMNLAVDDFPPLPSPHTTVKLPPGFNNSNAPNSAVPPPGFSTKTSGVRSSATLNISLSSVARQLTSSTSDDHIRIIKSCDSEFSPSRMPVHNYQQPPYFRQRNEELIQRIYQLVKGDQTSFDAFKSLSGKFRQNTISAIEYHSKCLDVLGKDDFFQILPELVVLLPDIGKQQELLAVHNNLLRRDAKNCGAVPKKNLWNITDPNVQLMVCATCQQVLINTDFKSHRELHDGECINQENSPIGPKIDREGE